MEYTLYECLTISYYFELDKNWAELQPLTYEPIIYIWYRFIDFQLVRI